MTQLTAERLRALLSYDQDTGVFAWKIRTSNRVNVGFVAGTINHYGYVVITVDGRKHYAHRLAWLHVTGEWTKADIDHINGVREDNRIANLREASRSENLQNQRGARTNNKTGFLGVIRRNKKFLAKIVVGGTCVQIGRYPTPEEAHAAYLAAKRELHSYCTI